MAYKNIDLGDIFPWKIKSLKYTCHSIVKIWFCNNSAHHHKHWIFTIIVPFPSNLMIFQYVVLLTHFSVGSIIIALDFNRRYTIYYGFLPLQHLNKYLFNEKCAQLCFNFGLLNNMKTSYEKKHVLFKISW